MKHTFLYLLLICGVIVGCEGLEPSQGSDVQDDAIVSLYAMNHIFGEDYKSEAISGGGDQYDIYIGYNEDVRELFYRDTYITSEMRKGKQLQFLVTGLEKADTVTNVAKSPWYSYTYAAEKPWQYDFITTQHDYLRVAFLMIPEEGTFEFRLKFEQPDNNNVFYSSYYRLEVEYIIVSDPESLYPYCYTGSLNKIE